jgi:hypothetical protein
MQKHNYTFGDVTFAIESAFDQGWQENCAVFRSEQEANYRIRLLPSDGEKDSNTLERTGNVITRYLPKEHFAGLHTASLLSTSEAAFLFLNHDAFILHASYILHNGQALLFTAPSGTGKSTQAEYWRQERGAEVINGDRVLITRRNGRFYANGVYASGTSGISKNKTAPVGAVILLEQGHQNEVCDTPARLLFLRILCECAYNMKDDVQYDKITELVSDMINSLPVICYRCQKSADSVAALERILWNKE